MTDSDPEYEYVRTLYARYAEERTGLNNTALEIGGRYDKALLAISGGAFGLSITFIEKIVPHPFAITVLLLALAWLALVIAMLASIMALADSQNAIQRQIAILDAEYLPRLYPDRPCETAPDTSNKYSSRVRTCNQVSKWALVLGLVFLSSFALLNLSNKETEHGRRNIQTETPAARKGNATTPPRSERVIHTPQQLPAATSTPKKE